MKPKSPLRQKQGTFLYQDLLEQLNPKAPLLLLAKRIPWEAFEREFVPLYADFGRPAKPIRLMVGYLMLNHLITLTMKELSIFKFEVFTFSIFAAENFLRISFFRPE